MITIHIEVNGRDFNTSVNVEGTVLEMSLAVTQLELAKYKLVESLILQGEQSNRPPLESE